MEEVENIIDKVMNECETIYFNHNEHYRAKIEMETREERFNKWLEGKYPNKLKNITQNGSKNIIQKKL